MDTTKQAIQVIKQGLALLDKKDQDGLKYRGISADQIVGNASAMVNKHAGKEALLKAWAVQEANRVCGFAWRKGVMLEEVEKDYRKLPDMEEAAKDYNQYLAERKVVADELESSRKVYADEDKDMELFKAVLNGMSKDEAEKEMAAYQEKLQQSIGR